ncbi:MAG: hypothetical protein H7249_08545 [Chitinophagaceae bacterium]|nr:hypothetical protein [Oligoflexus sp.]
MRKNDFDTRLIIYRSRQLTIICVALILTGVFGVMLVKNAEAGFPWYTLIMPISGLGLLTLLVPRTEAWEYKAWQSRARRIEQQER